METTTVDITPLVTVAFEYLSVILMAFAGVLATVLSRKANEWFGVQVEEKHRVALQDAMQHGLNLAANKVKRDVLGSRKLSAVDLKDETIAQAYLYVQSATPGAIKKFGITSGRLQQMLSARLDDMFFEQAVAENERRRQPSAPPVPEGITLGRQRLKQGGN